MSDERYDIPGHFEGVSSLFVPMIGNYGTHPAFPGYTDLRIRHRICRTWTNARGEASLPDNFEGLVDAIHIREGVKFRVTDGMDRPIMQDTMHHVGTTSIHLGRDVVRTRDSLATDLMFAVLTEQAVHTYECEVYHDCEREYGNSCNGVFYGLTSDHAAYIQIKVDQEPLPKLNDVLVSYRQLVVLGTKDGDEEIVDPKPLLGHLQHHWETVTNKDQYSIPDEEEGKRKHSQDEEQDSPKKQKSDDDDETTIE